MYSREKQFRQENPKPKKSHRNTPSFSSSLLDEICRSIDEKPEPKTPESAAFSKVEKWIENEKTVFRRRPRCDNAVFPDNDPLIFTSTSTSSASSVGAELRANRPKPVRTIRGGDLREKDCYLLDELERHRAVERDDLIKSKSRAMRIYANLKKMKQPISPGARLTSFFSSIFAGLNRKKSRGADGNDRPAAAESPAKMLTRCSTKSSDKMGDGIERNARFDELARVVVDRDAVPRGQRSLGEGRPPLPPNAFQNRKKCDVNKPDEGDAISESSSDLFELDHSSLFGIKDRFCDELPVYETTFFDKNRRLFR